MLPPPTASASRSPKAQPSLGHAPVLEGRDEHDRADVVEGRQPSSHERHPCPHTSTAPARPSRGPQEPAEPGTLECGPGFPYQRIWSPPKPAPDPGLVDVDARRFEVELGTSLDAGLVLHVQVEGGADVDLARLLRLHLEVFAVEHDLLLRVDLDVSFLRLDQKLLVLHVEGERPLPAFVGDDDLLAVLLVVESDLMTGPGLDHHGGVLVCVRGLHRLVLAVPERADDVRPVRLAPLEGDQNLVVDVREPVEPAP